MQSSFYSTDKSAKVDTSYTTSRDIAGDDTFTAYSVGDR